MSDPFLRVTTLFQEQCAHGAFPGGQLVAMRDGAVLCQIAIVTNGHRGVGDMVRRFAPLGSAIRKAAAQHA